MKTLTTTRATLMIVSIILGIMTARPATAADGVLIVQKVTTGTTTATNQLQLEKSRMRAETGGQPGSDKQAFIFNATRQALWIVNSDRKTYSEITKADVDRMSTQLNDAMEQMRQRIANLPPEQRAQAEAQIQAMTHGRGIPGAGGAIRKMEFKKTGTDTVAQWPCDKYEGYFNNQKAVELCTVPPRVLGFTDADLAISRQLADFFGTLLPPGLENLFRADRTEEQGYSGVPVRRVSFGARPSTAEIVSITRQAFPDSTFEVPQGFTKTELPLAGRGRGR